MTRSESIIIRVSPEERARMDELAEGLVGGISALLRAGATSDAHRLAELEARLEGLEARLRKIWRLSGAHDEETTT